MRGSVTRSRAPHLSGRAAPGAKLAGPMPQHSAARGRGMSESKRHFWDAQSTVCSYMRLFHYPRNRFGMNAHSLPFHRGGRLSLGKAEWLGKVTKVTEAE